MVGKTYENCEALRKGAKFLLKIQNSEGGFGESYLSYTYKVTTCAYLFIFIYCMVRHNKAFRFVLIKIETLPKTR